MMDKWNGLNRRAMPKRISEHTPTDELRALYSLLSEAIPLAAQRLTAGGVPAFKQWCFWSAFAEVEKWIDDASSGLDPGDDPYKQVFEMAAEECRPWPDYLEKRGKPPAATTK